MKFPVDLLADVSQAELEQSAHSYMNKLLYSSSDSPERLTLSDSSQVTIEISNVGFTPLYGTSPKPKLLALFSPRDPFTAVALYLLDQWWTVEDILKTADPARCGAVEAVTVGERIVLYILNRVIYRVKEMSSKELPFLCHAVNDHAKILWSDGEAVGFYSVKSAGSLCNSFSTRSYQLPVMDSMFVRKSQRGKGFGLQMLEDFVLTFKEDCLGLRYPLPKSMYKVCEKYLCQYPGDTDLLWEVESIGAPKQRTNIASKIQAMNLAWSVSKSLSFPEESLVITEVTEQDVEKEALTTQIKEAESMECTTENVEEVTVLRATKEAEEVPVVDISGTVVRIEDIEAETPTDQHASGQRTIALHDVSEFEPTEGMFSVAAGGKGEDGAYTAFVEEAAMMLNKPATVQASQDPGESEVTAVSMSEEPQIDDATQDLKNTSHDSQIIVENVASEIEKAEEACQMNNPAVLELHKEPEPRLRFSVGEGTEIEGKKSEERVTQCEIGPLTLVQNETPRQRSYRHNKLQDGAMEATTAKDGERVLRGRTVTSTSTSKRKSIRCSQKVSEELEAEVDEMAEENQVSAAERVQDLAATEREERDITSTKEDVVTVEDLPGEEKELPDTAETVLPKEDGNERVTDELEKEQKDEEVDTSVMQDNREVSNDDIEEPPVVHRRVVRGICEPKARRRSKRCQKQKVPSDDAAPGAEGSAEVKADEQAADKQMEENHQVEQEEPVSKTEEEISTKGLTVVTEGTILEVEELVEDVTPSNEVNVEESKEVQGEETEAGSADKEEEPFGVGCVTDDMIKEADTVPPSETVTSDEPGDEAVVPVAEETEQKDIGSDIPKLQKATVVLVDLKTVCHHYNLNQEEQQTVDVECPVPEKGQLELTAAEEKEVSSCDTEKQTSGPEMLMSGEEDGGKQENVTKESVNAASEADTVKTHKLEEDDYEKEKEISASAYEAEEVPEIETRVLRSGRKTVLTSCKSRRRSTEQEEKDNRGKSHIEKEMDEAETSPAEVEQEMEAVAKDGVTIIFPVQEEESAGSRTCAEPEVETSAGDAEEDEAISLDEEGTRALRSGTKTVTATPTHKTRSSRRQVDEQQAEEEELPATTRSLRQGIASVAEEGESVVDVQSEFMSITFAEREAEPSGEEHDEIELPQVAQRRFLRSGGKLSKAQPKTRPRRSKNQESGGKEEGGASVSIHERSTDEDKPPVETNVLRRGRKSARRLQEQTDDLNKSAMEAEVEVEEEAELGLFEAPPTEADKQTTTEEGSTELEKEEICTEEEKGVSEEGTMTVTEEEEKKTAGATAAAEQEGETDPPVTQPDIDPSMLTPSQEETSPSTEEQQTEEMESQYSYLQGATAVLVDLKTTHHEVQEETALVEEGVLVEGNAVEAEEEQRGVAMTVEETVAEVHVAGSPVEIEKTEPEKVVTEEEGLEEEKVEDVVRLQEETGEKSIKETEEENTEAPQLMVDQEKTETLEGKDVTQVENMEPETGAEKADAVAEEGVTQQDSAKEGQACCRERITDENTEAVVADERKTSDDPAEKTVTAYCKVEEGQLTSTSEEEKTLAEESEQKTALTSKDHEEKGGEKAESTKPQSKTRKRQDDELETAGEKIKEDKGAAETRLLRKGRRCPSVTRRQKSKRAKYWGQPEGEAGEVDSQAEETGGEGSKSDEKENNRDERTEERDSEVAVAHEEGNTGLQVEIEKVETVAGKLITEEETVEEEESAVSQKCAHGQGGASGGRSAEETPNINKGKVTDEEVSVVPGTKTTKSQEPENEEVETGVETSADADEPAAEPRVLRKRRRCASTTTQYNSKRAWTQDQQEGEEEVSTPESEGEAKNEEQESGEMAEEERKLMEVEKKKDVEEEEVKSAAVVGDGEQMKDATLTEGTAVLEKEGDSVATADETSIHMVQISSVNIEGTNSAEKEETTVNAVAKEEALHDDVCAKVQEEIIAVTTRALRSKTKSLHATPSQRSRREQYHAGVGAQQEEDRETREEDVHPLTDDSAENKELIDKEQAETEETGLTGQERGPLGEDTGEDQPTEKVNMVDRVVEPAAEELATEDMDSPEESSAQSQENETVDTSVIEGTCLRGIKTRSKEDRVEAGVQTPKRRSLRKRPRVDYRENNVEDEGVKTEATTDEEEKDGVKPDEDEDKKAEYFAEEQIQNLKENKEEHLEKEMGAIGSTDEKADVLHLVLDADEETTTVSQEHEEEKEVEQIVIGKRVLRGRSVPSVILTPRSRRQHTKVQESLSDEEKSPPSAERRSHCKRKSTGVTPARKSKWHSGVPMF